MDICVHVIELFVRDVNVYAAQHFYCIRNCFPVEGYVVLDVEIEV